jgi:hypothetical protein
MRQACPSWMTRGRREGRVSADTHGPRATKKHAAEPQVQPDTGLPCAMVLRLIRDLPGDRLSCPRSAPMRQRIAQDISTGMSGPHDFAVRFDASRLLSPSRPSQPALAYRDDAYAPQLEAGCGKTNTISVKTKVVYFSPAVFTPDDSLNVLSKSAVRRDSPVALSVACCPPEIAKSRTDLPDGLYLNCCHSGARV